MNKKIMLIFLRAVKCIAHILGYDVFCCAEDNGVGYVAYSNSGSKVISAFVDEAASIQAE